MKLLSALRLGILGKSYLNCNTVNTKVANVLNKGKSIHTTGCLRFHELDTEDKDKTPFITHVRDGFFLLKDEIKIWKSEVIEAFENDPLNIFPGSLDKVFTFESSEKLNQWVVTNDSDHNMGYSSSELTVNEYGKGVFKGVLNNEAPSDGQIKKTGFCNIRSVKPRKSFFRDDTYNWGAYTHLVLSVRGDGRPYLINLSTPGYYDILWNDMYQYVLHTRGGPYWQFTKIPFSKFVLSSKGKIQDLQTRIPLHEISNFGLTIADRVNGPFQLEIDYIGVTFDDDFEEESAYEMYKLPRNMANS